MLKKTLLMTLLAGTAGGIAQAQQAAPEAQIKPVPEAVKKHIEAAFALAGDDYFKITATLQCGGGAVLPQAGQPAAPGGFGDKTPVPATQVFDNLYYVGLTPVGAWAVKTSAGIILIDALNNAKDAEETIVPDLQKLGLDPAQIKYVVITHAHGDHYGGATYLKQKYGARIMMSQADWDVLARPPAPAPGRPASAPNFAPPPEKDLVATDGQLLTLGDTQLTLVVTPGHTPGTLSVIIPVKDKGVPHMAALWGGTGIPAAKEGREQYLASIDKFATYTKPLKVDAEISNHGFVDDSINRMKALREAAPGTPNPFVIGEQRYARYTGVLAECTQSKLAGM